MGQVWEIGKKRFGRDWRKRMRRVEECRKFARKVYKMSVRLEKPRIYNKGRGAEGNDEEEGKKEDNEI